MCAVKDKGKDADQPVQLLLRHLLAQLTRVPRHLHTVLL